MPKARTGQMHVFGPCSVLALHIQASDRQVCYASARGRWRSAMGRTVQQGRKRPWQPLLPNGGHDPPPPISRYRGRIVAHPWGRFNETGRCISLSVPTPNNFFLSVEWKNLV